MPLESCMLVLDNSEYMRNGDYAPTRFQAQAQAVSTVFTAKTDSNPESAVGLMTMAGKSPSLLVTPTNDIGKLLSALSKSQIGGTSDLQTAVQIAQLALKHRENKNQRQRIVVFVGSPLEDSKESLVKLGKRLRKNNVLIDVVSIGDEDVENGEKLEALVEAAGGGESHFVYFPPGQHLLADVIISSPILFDGEMGGMGGQGGGEGAGGDGGDGFDPNMDPELAMAIRMSLQEAEQAQRAQAGPSTTTEPTPSAPITTTATQPAESSTEAGATLPDTMTKPLFNADDPVIPSSSGDAGDETMDDDEDEDEMLRRAMALSRGEAGDEDVEMGEDEEEEDEEAAIARAIAMSLAEGEDKGKDGEKK